MQHHVGFQVVGLINTLAILIGEEISNETKLNFSLLSIPAEIPNLNRPELEYFKLQQEAILDKSDMLDVQKKTSTKCFCSSWNQVSKSCEFFK